MSPTRTKSSISVLGMDRRTHQSRRSVSSFTRRSAGYYYELNAMLWILMMRSPWLRGVVEEMVLQFAIYQMLFLCAADDMCCHRPTSDTRDEQFAEDIGLLYTGWPSLLWCVPGQKKRTGIYLSEPNRQRRGEYMLSNCEIIARPSFFLYDEDTLTALEGGTRIVIVWYQFHARWTGRDNKRRKVWQELQTSSFPLERWLCNQR